MVEASGWRGTACNGCYNQCGVLVRVEGGVLVDIAGDPANPATRGHICAKGKARVMDVYSPRRLLRPLRRTNPEKGIGVDPGWEEIGWEEALSLVAEKLAAARAKDPNGIVIAHFDMPAGPIIRAWSDAVGTKHSNWSAAGLFCGMGSHAVNMLVNGAFNSEIDFAHCRHAVLVGTQMGFMVDSNALHTTAEVAEARRRGMKLTVVDPVCGTAAGKADSWIPILPGTDGALGLGLLHQLLLEQGTYDADFLRLRTNAPYLVGADGDYARSGDGRPLVWSESRAREVPFDECEAGDMGLSGEHQLGPATTTTAFELLRRHVRPYTAEIVGDITGIEPERIRSLAAELAEDARIGETIEIDGVELPYRPVALNFKMGAVGHRHAMATALSLHLVNVVLGAIDVPGGFLGVNPIGPYWQPVAGPDGLLVPGDTIRSLFGYNSPFPGTEVKDPSSLTLMEMFPAAMLGRAMYPFTITHPEEYGVETAPEILLHSRVNLLLSIVNPGAMAEALRRIPFMVSFATEVDETAEFADVVLPDAHDLERDDVFPANHPFAFVAPGETDWYWARRSAVLPPRGESRPWAEVMIDLLHRLGLSRPFYERANQYLDLDAEGRLDVEGRHTIAEMADRQVACFRGMREGSPSAPKSSSTWVTGRRTVEEKYPGPFVKARLPVYSAFLLRKGREVEAAAQRLGLHWPVDDYSALPRWHPPAGAADAGRDLYAVTFKLPFLALGRGPYNAWLSELADRHPYAYRILVNSQTARSRGIRDGDLVEVTSRAGSVRGRAHVAEGIHRDVVGIAGTHGHWARAVPEARGKGVHFNTLLPMDVAIVDTLSSAFDAKPKVEIRRVAE